MKKYLLIIILAVIGIGLGLFIGLGGFAGLEIVLVIILFPVIFIFGMIIFGKESEKFPPEENKDNRWDRYE